MAPDAPREGNLRCRIRRPADVRQIESALIGTLVFLFCTVSNLDTIKKTALRIRGRQD